VAKNAPTETKVKAATVGAAGGAVLGEFVNWLIDDYLITPDVTGDLPTQVSALVLLVSAGVAAFLAGWWAKHSPRFTGES
jgi:hypothetical protein